MLGRHAFSRLAKLKLMSWLTEQEEAVRLVLYVADTMASSAWTQWCIRQVYKGALLALQLIAPFTRIAARLIAFCSSDLHRMVHTWVNLSSAC